MTNLGDPYRTSQAPKPILHVCLSCLLSYTEGPSECSRCELARVPVTIDMVYEELLRQGHRRLAVPRWGVSIRRWTGDNGSLLDQRPRWVPHLDPPKDGRAIEDLTRDELVAWLGLRQM